VAALVVADAGPRPDVTEEHVHPDAVARRESIPGGSIEHDHAAFEVGAKRGRHRRRITVVAQEHEDGVWVTFGDVLQRVVHALTSKTCGARRVSPPGQRNALRGSISMTARSQKSGRATRCATKASIAGSFCRQSGNRRSQP